MDCGFHAAAEICDFVRTILENLLGVCVLAGIV